MTDAQRLELLFDEMGSDVIAYHLCYAKITKSVTAGLLLSQLTYWSKKMNEREFYKKDSEFIEETGLGKWELDGAKKTLSELGFIKYIRKGIPAKTYYTVFKENIINAITCYRKNQQQVIGKTNNLSEEKPITTTETTTETTSVYNPPMVPQGDVVEVENIFDDIASGELERLVVDINNSLAPPTLKKEKNSAKKERNKIVGVDPLFDEMYYAYPKYRRQGDLAKTLKKFMVKDNDEKREIINSVKNNYQVTWKKMEEEGRGEYIPMLSTWFNQQRWLNEVANAPVPLSTLDRCIEITRKPITEITDEEIVFFVEHAGWESISPKLKGDSNTESKLFKVLLDKCLDPQYHGEYFRECKNEVRSQINPVLAEKLKQDCLRYLKRFNLTPDQLDEKTRSMYEQGMSELNVPPEKWYTE